MVISKLTLHNVGPFDDIELKFNKRINVIIGPNDIGKSTILNTIASMWLETINSPYLPRTKYGKTNSMVQMKIEEFPPFTLDYSWNINEKNPKEYHFKKKSWFQIPLITNNPYRRFVEVDTKGPREEDEMTKNKNVLLRLFSRKMNETVDESISQWIINRYFFSKEKWGDKYHKELVFFSEKIASIFSMDLEIKFDTVNERMNPVFKTKYGLVPYYSLSSGVQSIIYIIYNIINSLSKYYDESKNIFSEKSIILIDEIGVHLHPTWQRIIVNAFREMFPQSQFIMTTHSPIVSSSCFNNEVIQLQDINGKITPKYITNIQGWLAEDIFQQYMGLESSRDQETDSLIKKFYKLYYKKIQGEIDETDLQELNQLILELTSRLPNNDPTLLIKKLQALLSNLEKETK